MNSINSPKSAVKPFIRSVYQTGPSPDKPTGTKIVDTPTNSIVPSPNITNGDVAVKDTTGRALAS
ncbi:MAG: hypothetical protein HRT47_09440 [Candidatus Caenarcaniphilales bacterium]|nr:hypothetical protein [Candidatus Caenarcaniphilales bacterium]